MKTFPKTPVLIPALVAGLGLILAGRAAAQSFKTLYSFSPYTTSTNSDGIVYQINNDGAHPLAGLVVSGSTLYGVASSGGTGGGGTIFSVSTNGTGFVNLYSFSKNTFLGNTDGSVPYGGLVLSGGILYGSTENGGTNQSSLAANNGTLFAINAGGGGFTNLHTFSGTDGASPLDHLVVSGATIYGATIYSGGPGFSQGTLFKLGTDGNGFTTLHNFFFTEGSNNGAYPNGLLLAGNTLYGTCEIDGTGNSGSLFAIGIDGLNYTNLHSFAKKSGSPATNSDGSAPDSGLVLVGSTLFGTANMGGKNGTGCVFAMNTNGTGFTNLYNFSPRGSTYPYPNADGAFPFARLASSGNTLYGTTQNGGANGVGSAFAISTNGTGFTNLHSFTMGSGPAATNADGSFPDGGLVVGNGVLYGTTYNGGAFGSGTLFSITPKPELSILRQGGNMILAWPTSVAGFDISGLILQSSTNPVSSAVWTTVSPPPVPVNGLNTVTNPMAGTAKFYRLSQ